MQGPYVGLQPYDEDDSAFFFGRSQESAIVAANLRSTKLTLLYGPSGVGKSSLLMAGVVRGLREHARAAAGDSPFAVCVFRSWHRQPLRGLQESCRTALQDLAGESSLAAPVPGQPLTETLRAWTMQAGALFIVLDQFEEYFQYYPGDGSAEGLSGFAGELAGVVNDLDLAVHVLVSIREDAWASLDRFEGHIPSLFANYLRVDHLDRNAARKAITQPIAAWNKMFLNGGQPYEIEPALVDAVIEAAETNSGLAVAAGPETATAGAAGNRVEAPFLQLVLERLWRATIADGAHALTLARLEALGGSRRIVESHLADALGRLTREEQNVASDCFTFLVSRSRTKVAHPGVDLAEWTKRKESQVVPVLDKLSTGESGRILRPVATSPDDRHAPTYELYHDVLAEPVLVWRRTHQQERDRRRLLRVGGILVALVAVFAAISVWAVIERHKADSAAQASKWLAVDATARELAQRRDPGSLLLGLAANEAGETTQARSAMTLALERASGSGAVVLARHEIQVLSLATSPDGRTLAGAFSDGRIRLWDAGRRSQLGPPLPGHVGDVSSLVFSRTGRILAAAGDRGRVWLWDVGRRRRLGALNAGPAPVLKVVFSWDGQMLAGVDEGGRVWRWDVGSRRPLGAPVTGHVHDVFGVVFSRDGRMLAVAGVSGRVWLWDVGRGKQVGVLHTGQAAPVRSLAFSWDRKMLVGGGYGGSVWLWDVGNRRKLGAVRTGNPGPVLNVAISPDGRTLVSVAEDGVIQLWDAGTQKQLGTLQSVQADRVSSIAMSADGQTLAGTGEDGTVHLWDMATRRQLAPLLPGHTGDARVAFSRDGRTLASVDFDGAVRLWDVKSGRELGAPLTGRAGGVLSVAFSRDGRMLAGAGVDGRVWLWDVRSGRQLGAPLTGHAGPVLSVGFSPDGQTLASGGEDGTVRLWDVGSGRQLGEPLTGHAGPVRTVAISPDGGTLASADAGGRVRLWDGVLWRTVADLRTMVCSHVKHDLTADEWRQLAPGLSYRPICASS